MGGGGGGLVAALFFCLFVRVFLGGVEIWTCLRCILSGMALSFTKNCNSCSISFLFFNLKCYSRLLLVVFYSFHVMY